MATLNNNISELRGAKRERPTRCAPHHPRCCRGATVDLHGRAHHPSPRGRDHPSPRWLLLLLHVLLVLVLLLLLLLLVLVLVVLLVVVDRRVMTAASRLDYIHQSSTVEVAVAVAVVVVAVVVVVVVVAVAVVRVLLALLVRVLLEQHLLLVVQRLAGISSSRSLRPMTSKVL
jgi:hypothetical protein